MTIAKTRAGLKNLFNSLPSEIKGYFADLVPLVDQSFAIDIVLAYVFFKLEQGQRVALYCGARKLHKTETVLTWKAIDSQYITRDKYKEYFQTIYNFKPPDEATRALKEAEEIRDKVMHGSNIADRRKLEGISKALHYARIMNESIYRHRKCGFKPFNNYLRGVFGRLGSLDKSTTRWILKGMKFNIK